MIIRRTETGSLYRLVCWGGKKKVDLLKNILKLFNINQKFVNFFQNDTNNWFYCCLLRRCPAEKSGQVWLGW